MNSWRGEKCVRKSCCMQKQADNWRLWVLSFWKINTPNSEDHKWFGDLTFHLEWMELLDWLFFPIKCSHYMRHDHYMVHSRNACKMKNAWHIFAVLICLVFRRSYEIRDRVCARAGNVQFIVFCHCHKSMKRHNRLLIRSKLTNRICYLFVFALVCWFLRSLERSVCRSITGHKPNKNNYTKILIEYKKWLLSNRKFVFPWTAPNTLQLINFFRTKLCDT